LIRRENPLKPLGSADGGENTDSLSQGRPGGLLSEDKSQRNLLLGLGNPGMILKNPASQNPKNTKIQGSQKTKEPKSQSLKIFNTRKSRTQESNNPEISKSQEFKILKIQKR